jgi:hypothetical protein
MALPLPLTRPVIVSDSRRELNRLLAQAIANLNCGNATRAHEYKLDLIDLLHVTFPNPRAK